MFFLQGTTPKVVLVAEGLKYVRCQHRDVDAIWALLLPKPSWLGCAFFIAAGLNGRTSYNRIKFTSLSSCIMAKLYTKCSLLYNGKTLCQSCLAVSYPRKLLR